MNRYDELFDAGQIVAMMNGYKMNSIEASKKLHKFLKCEDVVRVMDQRYVTIAKIISEDVFMDTDGEYHIFDDIVSILGG